MVIFSPDEDAIIMSTAKHIAAAAVRWPAWRPRELHAPAGNGAAADRSHGSVDFIFMRWSG